MGDNIWLEAAAHDTLDRHRALRKMPFKFTSQAVSDSGIEWKTGAETRKWEKIGRKIENGPRPDRGKKWPKNGENMGFGVFPQVFFCHFGAIFPCFGPWAIFYFSANFFPCSGFGPVFHSKLNRSWRHPTECT